MSDHGASNPIVGPAWDTATDPANPQPNIWPQCPTCDTPWVWRRALSLSGGSRWCWMRDCRHKSKPVLTTEDGAYTPEGAQA